VFWTIVFGAVVVTVIALVMQHRQARRTLRARDDARHGANCVAGRAIAQETMRAPLSGRECVYWTVMFTGPSFTFSDSRTRVVGLETGSGERVPFVAGDVRYVLTSASPDERKTLAARDMPAPLRALLASEVADGVVFDVTETRIDPSSTIYVTGTTAEDGLHVDAIYDAPPRLPNVRPGPR
jgi:hypothetical protein